MSEPSKIIDSLTSDKASAGNVSPGDGRPPRRTRARRSSFLTAHQVSFFQPLPPWVWLVFGLAALGGLFTPNGLLTSVSVLMIPVLASLLWMRGEPPALLFACLTQWLQGSVAVLYTNWYGVSLQSVSGGLPLARVAWLSQIGILLLAIGMKLAVGRHRRGLRSEVENQTRLLSPGPLFVAYLIGFCFFLGLRKVADLVPGLSQPLLALAALRWTLVYLLAYCVLQKRRGYTLLAVMVTFEIIFGFLGFFGAFRNVFSILLVVMATAQHLFKGLRLLQIGFAGVIVVMLSIFWTVIKPEYRQFLNQGSGQQKVTVPVRDRIQKIEELARNMDRQSFRDGLDQLTLRVSYLNYFALSLGNVPENIPYEQGKLWFEAIKHTFMPRLFFPDKPVIDDSERTSHYTGVYVAGIEDGTSISIGYMGESYIDFGIPGMFVPIFCLGLFYGWIYRLFTSQRKYLVLGFAVATSILVFGAYNLETSNIKLVGGNVNSLLAVGVVVRFLGPTFWKMVTTRSVNLRSHRRARVPADGTPAMPETKE